MKCADQTAVTWSVLIKLSIRLLKIKPHFTEDNQITCFVSFQWCFSFIDLVSFCEQKTLFKDLYSIDLVTFYEEKLYS